MARGTTMSSYENLPDGFHTKPLDDGNIEFRFVNGTQQIAGRCTPVELGIVVTNLLNTAIGAFNNSGKEAPPLIRSFSGPVINVSRWAVGDTLAAKTHLGQDEIRIALGEAGDIWPRSIEDDVIRAR
jgi:hypothetical protein